MESTLDGSSKAAFEKDLFFRNNNFIKEIIIVDAISRSGKGMMAHILSSFARVEKQRNDEFFEYIPLMYGQGKMTRDSACAILRTQADTCFYNNLIGRDVNFRFSDDTGVFKNASAMRYVKRLFLAAGSAAVERAEKERPIFQNCVHDTIRYADILFDAFGDRLKMIYILRDPVDLIYEWQLAGFGKRIGHDPREFQYTFLWNEQVVPHAAKGWERHYLAMSPDDRVVALINVDLDLNLGHYFDLEPEQQRKILFLCFEDFVTNPFPYCERLAAFLGTTTTPQTRNILKREHCPRALDPRETRRRKEVIGRKVSSDCRFRFDEVLLKYARM